MHELGLVHRDIKPKNIMLSGGLPVVIDFGFAQYGTREGKDGKVCVTNQGTIKGGVRYVLTEDVAAFRGCQEGDAFAMGKTLFEVVFGTAAGEELSGRRPITKDAAEEENAIFRAVLASSEEWGASRFVFATEDERDALRGIISVLCRAEGPALFAKAEEMVRAQDTVS